MHHVMLDLETLGTSSNAAIIVVGAIFFDPKTGKTGVPFYQIVKGPQDNNGIIDADTVLWWMAQAEMLVEL